MVEITQADIVERLRNADAVDWPNSTEALCTEAADTIERLQATIAALEQPTPELVEAVARGIWIRKNRAELWDNPPSAQWWCYMENKRKLYKGQAEAALAAAAKHLKGEG